MSRTRSRQIAANRGHVYRTYRKGSSFQVISDADGAGADAISATMIDVDTGDFVTPNYCRSDKVTRVGGTFTGYYYYSYVNFQGLLVVDEWIADQFRMSGASSNIPIFESYTSQMPTLSELAMKAAGSSSPAKPHVALPVSLLELRELPRSLFFMLERMEPEFALVRKRGGHRIKRPPKLRPRRDVSNNQTVGYDFGLMPVVRDIVNLFSLPKFVDDRIDRIRANAGVLREHRNVHSHSIKTVQEGIPFNTAHGISVQSRKSITYSESARGTVVWTPKKSVYTTSDQEMRDKAMALALGLSPTQLVYNMWELLPWSWLMDWFGNTGDALAANAASFDYNCDITISTVRQIQVVYDHTSVSSWGSATKAVDTRRRWERTPHVFPLWAPFKSTPAILSPKQLLTLLSIADNVRGRVVG